ncbi:methyltransferase domain-containing protein [Streptomyces sp. NBC_01498]|uniref:methyltransferase domain-containing protein n=1 Tax=Streptomyces sp. NBC_01498 TaxID=2975870 RepID=UPI002E7C049B|nr:methyltransferase domain-containing protein [Streptomyces sp. NBC_01498]WTL25321.1 methyltransferase domain-containing protein [Streptomyces sp. NBC_01498]
MSGEGSPACLARQLAEAGRLGASWRDTFTRVDRGLFIPDRVWVRGEGGYHPVDRATEPDRWRALVHDDQALVTQVEDYEDNNAHDDSATATPTALALVPSSSASMPRVVALMLDQLAVTDGMTVLEAGTGTGYNAALLAARLGDQNVVSVEMDPRLADTARARLKDAGRTPTVITGDGDRGWPARAPYDRVIATYALHTVPYAFVEQTTPGGVIVLPWGTGLYNGVLLRLTVADDGTASGPVVGDCAFMWNRQEAPERDVMATVRATDANDATAARTRLDPREVFGDENAAFSAGVLVPECRYAVGHGPDGEFTVWLADRTTGSWASVDHVPGATGFDVRQHGPRRLWDEVESAYARWRRAGSPDRARYGLTVTPTGRRLWLDSPETPAP